VGTLVNFTNMKRVNTRGIKNANKYVLMVALTYNLKKYLRFVVKKTSQTAQNTAQKAKKVLTFLKKAFYKAKEPFLRPLDFEILKQQLKIAMS
jgi:hypothetical protein